MKSLPLAGPGERLSVLCIGAHSDDIEIGAGDGHAAKRTVERMRHYFAAKRCK